jgi:hypothetical protein
VAADVGEGVVSVLAAEVRLGEFLVSLVNLCADLTIELESRNTGLNANRKRREEPDRIPENFAENAVNRKRLQNQCGERGSAVTF